MTLRQTTRGIIEILNGAGRQQFVMAREPLSEDVRLWRSPLRVRKYVAASRYYRSQINFSCCLIWEALGEGKSERKSKFFERCLFAQSNPDANKKKKGGREKIQIGLRRMRPLRNISKNVKIVLVKECLDPHALSTEFLEREWIRRNSGVHFWVGTMFTLRYVINDVSGALLWDAVWGR